MKRYAILIVLLQAAAFLFAQNPEAVIREMSGTVELKPGGAKDWKPAKAGDKLEKETIISTGFKSSALLTVGNSTMMVRPLTRLSLEALLADREVETINVGLRTGRIQVSVNPPTGTRSNMTVQTPVATASVRGTVFTLDPVNLTVMEGAVNFAPAGEQAGGHAMMVYAGQGSWIDTDTGTAVNPLTAAETKRSLPALPGQNPGQSSGAEGGPRLQSPRGSVEVNVTLESGGGS